ncbi:MAG: hypothetical protein AAGF53_02345 [Pseudomonadota bacterium]
MCTGIEVALAAASVGGGLLQRQAEQDRQKAIRDAENRELDEFRQRNKERSDKAYELFAGREDQIQPEQVAQQQSDAETNRTEKFDEAIDQSRSTTPAPVKGSAPTLIGDVFSSEEKKGIDKSKSRAAARAKAGSFGDTLFNQSILNADAGRKIATIGNLSQADAALLPNLQTLAGHSAGAGKGYSLFGDILSGASAGGGFLAGAG